MPTSTLNSYGDVSRKESVMSLIEILTAEEKQIFNMLSKTRAIDTVHSTLADTLRTAASAAVSEDADYTLSASSTPVRYTNLVELVVIPFGVSRMQQSIQHYHGENELQRQTTKALMDWGNSAEFDLVRSTLVSGVSGTTPKMAGLIAHISKGTNTTVQTSGTVWSASIMKGLMKANLDNSNGDVASDMFMGSFLKDKTDDFVNKSTNVVTGSNQREIVLAVDVFQTGLGKLRVHFHRYVQQAADLTGRVLAINPDKHSVAVLEDTFIDKGLARSGPYDLRAVTGSFTLATRNKDSNLFASGYSLV